jgi:hypothetical protein
MARTTLSLELEGEVTLADLAQAIQTVQRMADLVSDRVAHGATVRWVVRDLEAGSARAEAVGVYEDETVVDRIIEEIEESAKASEFMRPGDPALQAEIDQLTAMVNGSITAIRLGGTERYELRPQAVGVMPLMVVASDRSSDLGEVSGRVEAMNSHDARWFNVYDLIDNKRVRCTLSQALEGQMKDIWQRLVTVEGRVQRDAVSGRPLAVTEVTNITIHDEPDPGAWRSAIGVVSVLGDNVPTNEETIERFRDA